MITLNTMMPSGSIRSLPTGYWSAGQVEAVHVQGEAAAGGGLAARCKCKQHGVAMAKWPPSGRLGTSSKQARQQLLSTAEAGLTLVALLGLVRTPEEQDAGQHIQHSVQGGHDKRQAAGQQRQCGPHN